MSRTESDFGALHLNIFYTNNYILISPKELVRKLLI